MILEIGQICRDIAAGGSPGELTPYLVASEPLAVGDPESEDDGDPVFVLPDLHLLSGDRHYKEFFHLNQSLKARLMALLRRLAELREDREYNRLRLIQIGDFHDLWREQTHWWGEAVATMLNRQIEAHHDLFELLAALGCHRVVGNHDDKLAQNNVLDKLRGHPISAYFPPGSVHSKPISLRRGAYGRADILHGHEVDPAEQAWWRKLVNPVGCRLACPGLIGETDEWKHEVVSDGTADGLLAEQPIIYVPGDDLDDTQKADQLFYPELAHWPTWPDDASAELVGRFRSSVVIGHTHRPRVVRGLDACDYVLVDCGSWVNRAEVVDRQGQRISELWNGQLGILSGPWAAVVQIGT